MASSKEYLDFLTQLFNAIYEELPNPKKKKQKTQESVPDQSQSGAQAVNEKQNEVVESKAEVYSQENLLFANDNEAYVEICNVKFPIVSTKEEVLQLVNANGFEYDDEFLELIETPAGRVHVFFHEYEKQQFITFQFYEFEFDLDKVAVSGVRGKDINNFKSNPNSTVEDYGFSMKVSDKIEINTHLDGEKVDDFSIGISDMYWQKLYLLFKSCIL